MRRAAGLALLALALVVSPAGAPIFFVEDDEFDDRDLVVRLAKDPIAEVERLYLDSIKTQLRGLREAQVESILGKGRDHLPEHTFAMPVCQPRFVGMTGLSKAGETQRTRCYVIKDVGAFKVYYGWGDGPPAILVTYLKVDDSFAALSYETFRARIDWDEQRLRILQQRLGHLVDQWRKARGHPLRR